MSNESHHEDRVRVLHVITRLIVGGAQENTIDTCHRLDRSRYDVDLVAGPQLGSEGELVSTIDRSMVGFTVLRSLGRELNPLKDLIALIALRRLMRKGRYRIVHTHSSKAGILGRLAARLAGVPVIVHTVHGWGFHDGMGRARKRLYVTLERTCGRFTDRLITVSERDANTGVDLGIAPKEKFVTIHSAIDLRTAARAAGDRERIRKIFDLEPGLPVVGSVGRLSPQKAPMLFMEMAAAVLKRVPRVNFLYVGDGPLRGEVEGMIGQLGIADRVRLVGLRRDVPELVKSMDIFVLLSLWEGLPRTIPQAMAAGLPVVASDVGGAGELVRDGVSGFLVPAGDYAAAAERVIRLLGDVALRRRMGEEGRISLPADFSVETMVRRIEGLYEGLLREKGLG
ncbi:MAG: glycosyltransferase family 4 protein [Candidatus Aureabacteria bacterium]|nr:glycosyltransferase family 4 protein [Candidatus Auribacterota bacterium]